MPGVEPDAARARIDAPLKRRTDLAFHIFPTLALRRFDNGLARQLPTAALDRLDEFLPHLGTKAVMAVGIPVGAMRFSVVASTMMRFVAFCGRGAGHE